MQRNNKHKISHQPEVTAALVAVAAFLLLMLIFQATPFQSEPTPASSSQALQRNEVQQDDPFEDIALQAQAAYVWNARTKQPIYAMNPNTQLPLASLTKLMTALVAHKSLPQDARVVINDNDLAATGDYGLLQNESWAPDAITDFTLVESSNDGARALASAINAISAASSTNSTNATTTTDLMNRQADKLGLEQTFFLNPSGLDMQSQELSGGYGTARDVTLLVDYLLNNNLGLLDATTRSAIQVTSLDNINHTATNTNKLVGTIPLLMASKTGYTDQAGGNLTIAFNAGVASPYIITVLGSTREGRFEDVRKLYDATIEYAGRSPATSIKAKDDTDNN